MKPKPTARYLTLKNTKGISEYDMISREFSYFPSVLRLKSHLKD